jgi:hypothetical protein
MRRREQRRIRLAITLLAAFYAGFFGDDSKGGKLAALLFIPGALEASIGPLLVAILGGGGGGEICLE